MMAEQNARFLASIFLKATSTSSTMFDGSIIGLPYLTLG
jgi:hypothetical protein